jgi:hypothetical protein
MLVDEEETIARVKNERWRLSRKPQDEKESDEKNAVMCEEARDRVLEWCAQHNPRSTMETWTAEKSNAKAVTELLQTTMGDTDFVCTREMWQAAIRVRDDLLVPLAVGRFIEQRPIDRHDERNQRVAGRRDHFGLRRRGRGRVLREEVRRRVGAVVERDLERRAARDLSARKAGQRRGGARACA